MRFIIQALIMVLVIYSSACFLTLMERKVLGYVQNRKGPTKLIISGLVQPVVDGGKLLMKSLEGFSLSMILKYFFVPFLAISLMGLMSVGVWFAGVILVVNSGALYILIISSLMVYVIFMLGYGSESSYGVSGGLRSSSQMVAYEIIMFFMIILLMLFFLSWSFMKSEFNVIYMSDLMVLWFTVALAETNRSPYDFAEGESELVSGYNVEYMGVLFALMFISEYGLIIIFSWVTSLLLINGFVLVGVLLLILVVRGFIPRSRYDILMMVCWKFLFILLSFSIIKMLVI